MKKRIICILLSLMLMLSMTPQLVLALSSDAADIISTAGAASDAKSTTSLASASDKNADLAGEHDAADNTSGSDKTGTADVASGSDKLADVTSSSDKNAELTSGSDMLDIIDPVSPATLAAPTTFTVSFDANGGGGSMEPVSTEIGEFTIPDVTFTLPEGKQFKGWSTSANGEIITTEAITVTESITLYAIWENLPEKVTGDYTLYLSGGSAYKNSASESNRITGNELAALRITGYSNSTGGYTYVLSGTNFETTASTALRTYDANPTFKLAAGTVSKIKGGSSSSTTYGVYTSGNLTITGSGSLTVTGGNSTGGATYGTKVRNNCTINGGNIKIIGGNTSGNTNTDYSYGISVSSCTVNGGTVCSYGGGTSERSSSYGIKTHEEGMTVNGGSFTGTGGSAGVLSAGICSIGINGGKLAVNGGSITGVGGEAPTGRSIGIIDHGRIVKSGGVITAISVSNSAENIAFSSTNKITITGATLILKSNGIAYRNNGFPSTPKTLDNGVNVMNVFAGTSSDGSGAALIADWKGDGKDGTSTYKYMKFTKKATVSFDANGGSGSIEPVSNVDGSYTLPECTFTRPEGKRFKGWATSADGEVITTPETTVIENTTFYAIWENLPEKVTGDYTLVLENGNLYKTYVNENYRITGDELAALRITSSGNSTDGYTYTLSGTNFETTASPALSAKDLKATLELAAGTANKLKGGDSNASDAIGISSDFSLIFTGSGSLKVTGGTSISGRSYGGLIRGSMTVNSGDIEMNGGTAGGYSTQGAEIRDNLTVNGGAVSFNAGTTTGKQSMGVYISGDTKVTGGSLSAYASNGEEMARGIVYNKNLTVTGGKVTGVGGVSPTGMVVGIDDGYSFASTSIITGGTVTAVATGAASRRIAYAVTAQHSTLSITGGTLILQSGATVCYDYENSLQAAPQTLDNGANVMAVSAGTSTDGSGAVRVLNWKGDGTDDVSAYKYMKLTKGLSVSFNANGHGTAPSGWLVGSGDKITKPADPTAENCVFEGWYKEAACTNEWNFDTDVVTAAITLYAKWHVHGEGTLHSLVPANCGAETNGVKEYYICSCGDKYYDEACTEPVLDEADLVIEWAHSLTHHSLIPAECVDDGSIEHWECDTCGKLFSDAAGITLITQTAIPATGHDYYDTDNDDHCDICGAELEEKYIILEGAGLKLTKGHAVTFTSDAEFVRFLKVALDGADVSPDNYTAEPGSTKITLSKEFMNSLSLGEHKITISSNDGYARTTFKMVKAQSSGGSPDTGDSGNIALWAALMCISAAALTFVSLLVVRKKKAAKASIQAE